ncbi:MAG TPA: glycosyltransferase 87 family protein [Ktedonobacteraceae bacterium]|nr:glycosyltransferase 87 family protein [Ktedonobacteraceae bacterium]
MQLRSVFTPQAAEEQSQTPIITRWLRHFFTEDISPDNLPIVDLQRRACWIGVAFILQALNEVVYDWNPPFLKQLIAFIPFVLILGSFAATWIAFRPQTLQQRTRHLQAHPQRWQRRVLLLTVILAIIGATQLVRVTIMCFLPPQMSNDGTSLDTNAAILLVEGRNPYTDSNILDLARRFPIQPNWTTPLRRGQFADRLDYPSMTEFQTTLDTDLKAGAAPEFESKVSYPALSFLTLVPFALFNDYNVLPFYFAGYLLLIFVAWKVVRPELRPWVLLLSLANIPMWISVVGGNLDIFVTLLIVLAWLLRTRRWASALLFGLALATKQTSWFLVPFYLIMIGRNYTWKEAIGRGSIAGGVALLFNLPFMLWNFHAWMAGILAPVADPMFPMGVGLVNLNVAHVLPYFPGWVYSAMEGIAMLAMLAWYWRLSRKHPEAALLLAVIPLFLAWRSLSSYFYCAAFPIFILLAARPTIGKAASRLLQGPMHDQPARASHEHMTVR